MSCLTTTGGTAQVYSRTMILKLYEERGDKLKLEENDRLKNN